MGPVPVTVGAGFSFKCSQSSGALLRLGEAPVSMHIQAKRRIVSYMKENFDSWMHFANEIRELGIEEDALYFVSGTTKTTCWFLAAFGNRDYSDKEGYVSFDAANMASARVSITIDHEDLSGTNMYNRGPMKDSMNIPACPPIASSPGATSPLHAPRADQCVFIHYYRMKRRLLYWRKPMEAGAGPHIIQTGRRDDDDEDDMGSGSSGPVEFPLHQKVY